MSTTSQSELIRVGTVKEVVEKGVVVVHGADRPIAVFNDDGEIRAVDNRCPHMGFPLHKGTIKDGILTCHWHEARFDLCSGCTFDLWADDVPAYEIHLKNGDVFVAASPRVTTDQAYYMKRLRLGMEHGIGLISAKAINGLLTLGADVRDIVREVALFGSDHHERWDEGMTILTIVANLREYLSEQTLYFALVRAIRQVANDSRNPMVRRRRESLDGDGYSLESLSRWFAQWHQTRHRDGSERVLLTAIKSGASLDQLTELLFPALNDRVYADSGHVYDLANKAVELTEFIGHEYMAELLPLALPRALTSHGAEEDSHWHYPNEIIEPLQQAEREIEELMKRGEGAQWDDDGTLQKSLLGDNAIAIIDALKGALGSGASPVELSKRVAYAAAMRLARFAKSNEVGDWFNPQHTFNYTNAVHQSLKRNASPAVARGIFHGAMSVYQDRFLNMPAARLPGERGTLDDLPTGASELLDQLLNVLDQRSEIDEAARIVSRYLRLDHKPAALIDTLMLATVREDHDFHTVQVLEDGVRQFFEWGSNTSEAEHIMVGVVRQLAAFCPTPRAGSQTATIARRLYRGEKVYDEEGE